MRTKWHRTEDAIAIRVLRQSEDGGPPPFWFSKFKLFVCSLLLFHSDYASTYKISSKSDNTLLS